MNIENKANFDIVCSHYKIAMQLLPGCLYEFPTEGESQIRSTWQSDDLFVRRTDTT